MIKMAKKEKTGKVPYAREKKGFLEETGASGEARHNPKAPSSNVPYKRKKADFLEETGTDDHPRFRTGK